MIMIPITNSYSQNWLPNLFNEYVESNNKYNISHSTPEINIIEYANRYQIEVAAPGLTKEDFSISLTNEDYITIALNKNDNINNKKKYLRQEFSYSKFKQTLTLPEDVDIENISASMKNGILSIDLYKIDKEKRNEPRTIEIK